MRLILVSIAVIVSSIELLTVFDHLIERPVAGSSSHHEESWERLAKETAFTLPEGHFKKGFGMHFTNAALTGHPSQHALPRNDCPKGQVDSGRRARKAAVKLAKNKDYSPRLPAHRHLYN